MDFGNSKVVNVRTGEAAASPKKRARVARTLICILLWVIAL